MAVAKIKKINMDFTNIKPAKPKVKVLGSGCSKCKTLEKSTRKAIEELNIDAEVEKIEDIQQIIGYGILQAPGLVINESIVLSGEVPKIEKLKEIIAKHIKQ